MTNTLVSFLLALTLAQPTPAQFDGILGRLGKGGSPSESTTASGLKEALQIGTDRAVDLTGTTDGFFRNHAIKILMPQKFRTAAKGLRLAVRLLINSSSA